MIACEATTMKLIPLRSLAALLVLVSSVAAAACDRTSGGDAAGKPTPTPTDRPQPPPPSPPPAGSRPPPDYSKVDCARLAKPKDADGYLEKICRYLVKTGTDVSPSMPDAYSISRVETQKDTIVVHLDCCYMGDIAYIDKGTGEVRSFRVGAK